MRRDQFQIPNKSKIQNPNDQNALRVLGVLSHVIASAARQSPFAGVEIASSLRSSQSHEQGLRTPRFGHLDFEF